MKYKILISIILIFLFSGCSGLGQIESISNLSISNLKNMNKIQLLKDAENIKYDSFGKIKGLSCKGSANSGSASKDGAMTQLKIKAIKLNANAILYTTCSHDASVDWSNNCWESWVCFGEAIKLK